VDSIRRGKLAMVNALGSGVLEMRALLAFMPRLCAGVARRAAEVAQHRRRGGVDRRASANMCASMPIA